MSNPQELVSSIRQHEDFWRNDYAANRRNSDDTAKTRRRARRLPQEQARGNSTERSAELRLWSAA